MNMNKFFSRKSRKGRKFPGHTPTSKANRHRIRRSAVTQLVLLCDADGKKSDPRVYLTPKGRAVRLGTGVPRMPTGKYPPHVGGGGYVP